MSRVVLCTGNRAKTPYLIKALGVRVYSIEELCYALGKNLDVLDETVIDRDMARFMIHELGLTQRGELLEQLILTDAGIVDRLVVILCSCDYYSEEEIRNACSELEKILKLSKIGRMKKRADRFMSENHYQDAQREYKNVLDSPNCRDLGPEGYGAVLHNLGVIEGSSGQFDEAAEYFLEAYERNESEQSLKNYLFALKLGHHEDMYISEALKLAENRRILEEVENELEITEENAEQSSELAQMNRMKGLLAQGRASEFERLSGEVIRELKKRYREDVETL